MARRGWQGAVVALVIVLTLLLSRGAYAEESQVSLWVDWVDVTGFPDVTVHLNVWDSSGLPVTGLTADDFQVWEDDGPALRPVKVVEDTQAPVQVVLVLDVSGSMAGQPLADAKTAAARFLDRLGAGDQAALIAFSSPVDPDPAHLNSRRELGFTGDLTPVYEAVENLQSGGETALYNAVQKAVALAAAQPVGHRAVLLLTDGRNEPADVGDPVVGIALAQRHHVPVFVIGLGQDIDETYLQKLATETGGLFRKAPSSAELARLFGDMATLLKTQYRLTYRSALAADGKEHTLRLVVHTPQGVGEVAEGVALGPLPQPTPTSKPSPTIAPTATAVPSPTPLPSPSPLPEVTPAATSAVVTPSNGTPWWIIAAGGGLLLLGAVIALAKRRRKQTVREFCAQCGYELTDHTGACPVCGSTKRLRKP